MEDKTYHLADWASVCKGGRRPRHRTIVICEANEPSLTEAR